MINFLITYHGDACFQNKTNTSKILVTLLHDLSVWYLKLAVKYAAHVRIDKLYICILAVKISRLPLPQSWTVSLKRRIKLCQAKTYGGPKVSRQIQFAHGKFNLLKANSICSRQFQYFNLLAASHCHSLNRRDWGQGCVFAFLRFTRECYSNLCFTKDMNTKKLFKY